MRRKLWVAVPMVMALAGTTAKAEPVFLRCVLEPVEPGKPSAKIEFAVDEQASRATVTTHLFSLETHAEGGVVVEQVPAMFTETEVVFKKVSDQYRIDRATLAMTDTWSGAFPRVTKGTCNLAPKNERKF